MLAVLRDMAENFSGDVQRGWNATPRALMTGKLAALAVSVPLILLLALATPLGIGVAVIFGVIVQLFLGWAIAGRDERLNGR